MQSASLFDTIVACITASTPAPVAIVRVSGPEAWTIAAGVFPSWPSSPTHALAKYGSFSHGDDGYAIGFEEGRSYTGEWSAEFFIHGSPASIKLLIGSCISLGSRMAQPGEFTLRAFQNGRIDLTEAEAVRDTIDAETAYQLAAANDLRFGALLQEISELRESLVTALTAVEASVDFSEEIGNLDVESIQERLTDVETRLEFLLATAETGRIVREGYRIAIVGPPNAGKSSLLNALLGADRAIVTPTPGTTRDTIEEAADFNGLKVILTDTAGLRDTEDEVEAIGVERSHRAARAADYVWYVIDATQGFLTSDSLAVRSFTQPLAVIINKMDLMEGRHLESRHTGPWLEVSAVTRVGLDELIDQTVETAFASATTDLPYIQMRHTAPLTAALKSVQECLDTLTTGRPDDLLSIDLAAAIASLGEITGETADADIIHRIFHDFCIGK